MLELQVSNEIVIGASLLIALIVALIISLVVYFVLRRGVNSLKSQVTSDLNNFRLNLPRFDEVKEMKDRIVQMEEVQKFHQLHFK